MTQSSLSLSRSIEVACIAAGSVCSCHGSITEKEYSLSWKPWRTDKYVVVRLRPQFQVPWAKIRLSGGSVVTGSWRLPAAVVSIVSFATDFKLTLLLWKGP